MTQRPTHCLSHSSAIPQGPVQTPKRSGGEWGERERERWRFLVAKAVKDTSLPLIYKLKNQKEKKRELLELYKETNF